MQLPSKLQYVSKQPHKIPFPPIPQTAENVGSVVKCAECKKPRLMFSQKSLKENEKKSLKRALNGIKFICGTSFQEFVMDTKNEDINVLDKVFVRENLSCMSIVENPYFCCDFQKCIFIVVLLRMLLHQWIYIQSAISKGVRKRKMY